MRAFASSTISFGVLAVPVKIFSIKEADERSSIRTIHKLCGHPLKQQMTCAAHGETAIVVPKNEQVKGLEVSKGQFVEVIEDAPNEDPPSVMIVHRAHALAEIKRKLHDSSYYLGADRLGEPGFVAIQTALAQTRGVMLTALSYARGKSNFVGLTAEPETSVITMHQLVWPERLRDPSAVPAPAIKAQREHVMLVKRMIQSIRKTFDPSDYKEEPTAEAKVALSEKVISLEDALRESLAQLEKKRPKGKATKPRRAV